MRRRVEGDHVGSNAARLKGLIVKRFIELVMLVLLGLLVLLVLVLLHGIGIVWQLLSV